jgi:heme/copper-type cytochrome/quinol oxidase subunit 1
MELDSTGQRYINIENLATYNIMITYHAILMIFLLVMPVLLGVLGNIFIPILIGTLEVGYPRLNIFSLMILIGSYLMLEIGLLNEFITGTGWTLYPPLSTLIQSLSTIGLYYLSNGILINGLSSSITGINMFSTIQNTKYIGIKIINICMFICSLEITNMLLI